MLSSVDLDTQGALAEWLSRGTRISSSILEYYLLDKKMPFPLGA